MSAELGQVALLLAFLLAIVQGVFPLIGAWNGNARWMALGRSTAVGQFIMVFLAFLVLVHAFVVQDFSVSYVADNSNLKLPWYYRVSAVWGSHEGSLLLWQLILAGWTLAVAAFSSHLPERFVARVLAVMGWITVGFISFMIFTSNPFERYLPAPLDGHDLNPLLQDFGLIVHPPMLYMGYVGFSVAFAFAIAALLDGKVEEAWVRWSRPWTLVAWAFLTAGIALGSWWAYYELGWGGWWFWDPVENASFMPWLVGTALIHSQAVTEKRGTFRNWTLLLAISAFSLSLLGTFLVRSGVLTSVHAFANDPERGMYILAFLGIVVGGALTIFALRAHKIGLAPPAEMWSRETLLLANNVLLTTTCAMVLLGTLWPLAAESLGMGKVSVGPPYFGLMFTLIVAPLVALIPFGPLVRWAGDAPSTTFALLRTSLIAAVTLGVVVFFLRDGWTWRALLGVSCAAWIALGTFVFLRRRWQLMQGRKGWLGLEMAGMATAHLGVAVWLVGVVMVVAFGVERDVRMSPGDSTRIGEYEFRMTELTHREGPNFSADKAVIELWKGETQITTLKPEKRQYLRGEVMTEAGIRPGLTGDLFVAMGEPLDGGQAWSIRVQHKPYIRWVWFGAVLMLVGGLLAAAERRFRIPLKARESAPAAAAPASAGTPTPTGSVQPAGGSA